MHPQPRQREELCARRAGQYLSGCVMLWLELCRRRWHVLLSLDARLAGPCQTAP